MKRITYISAALGSVVLLLTACFPPSSRPPPEPYKEYIKPGQKVSIEQVKRDMVECGHVPERGYAYRTTINQFDVPNSPYSVIANEEVLGQECMFAKGYVFDNGWGGLCSVPERRSGPRALPNCKNAPIRPISGN